MSVALQRRGLIRAPRGLFSFPGTRPGFDPSHVASRNARVSAVAFGSVRGAVNLFNGQIGTNGSNNSDTIVDLPIIGRSLNVSSGVNNGVKFTSNVQISSATTPQQTLAAIFTVNATGLFQYACGVGTTGGCGIGLNNSGQPIFARFTATSYQPGGFTFSAGVPYFMIGSTDNATSTLILIRRLDNGAVSTFSTTGSAIVSAAAEFDFGTANSVSNGLNGRIACAMYSEAYLPLPQLLQWSSDPWSFWYPR